MVMSDGVAEEIICVGFALKLDSMNCSGEEMRTQSAKGAKRRDGSWILNGSPP